MKKCIAIFAGYVSPHLGGIERYLENLIKEFNKLGYKILLVSSNYNNEPDKEEKDGNLIIKLPIYNIFKNRYPIIKHNKKFRSLMKELDKYEISSIIVNTRFHLTSHVGSKYGKKHRIPVFLIEHGSNYVTLDNKFIDFFANRYEDFLTWRIKKKVKSIYGVSEASREWLKRIKIDMKGVWHNSIDIHQKLPKKEKHDTVNFLFAGRLIKQKGVDNILQAFCKLNQEYDNLKLFIAGDGPKLEEYKNNYQDKNIEYLGMLNYEQLLKYYAKTDVFLYPSLWPEGIPCSILEAGLMECAIIGTAQGGIKEIVKDGETGIIVDTNMPSLYEGMKKLIDNKELLKKYAKNMNKVIKEEYSWESTAKKIIDDINEEQES